jgi:sugar phosphate isomerase/epimerase
VKIGVLTVLFSDEKLDKVLDYLSGLGVKAVEIGCGGFPGKAHCDPDILLTNDGKLNDFKKMIEDRGMELAALSCHGNPLHPQEDVAQGFIAAQHKAIRLAEKLGVDRIITFSGCPGDSDSAKYPNWVTCPWPEDFLKILEWQWNEKVIPFWEKEVKFANDHGVKQIALEMHPGFVVYNPETLLKLRAAVGETIGANFDPSHLFWQGIDPVAAIRMLGDSIYFVHAKDCKIDPINTGRIGVLDTKHYGDELNRSWIFRTVGYGHGYEVWKDIISALRMVGYDDVLSIEHEDSLASPREGFEKALQFLKEVTLTEKTGDMWWA